MEQFDTQSFAAVKIKPGWHVRQFDEPLMHVKHTEEHGRQL